jgi:hypothetical protein
MTSHRCMTGRRPETLYRIMYESFTPAMMRRTPMWLKRRIARVLGYRLVRELSTDAFMHELFTAKPGEMTHMSAMMFENSVGGYSMRPFFRPANYWRAGKRIWRGETHTPQQLAELGRASVPLQAFLPPEQILQRRQF